MCLERSNRPFGMEAIGQGDVDGVDLSIVNQGTVAVKCLRNGMLLCKRTSALKITGCNGSHDNVGIIIGRIDRRPWRDARRTENTKPDGIRC